MNELDFQGNLVDAARDRGWHAFKCNNRFLVGVADLSLKPVGFGHAYIECKKHNTFKKVQQIGLTPHQLKFLREYYAAGGLAGWVTFAPLKGKRDCYQIFASGDLTLKSVDFDLHRDRFMVKMRGEPWPIAAIYDEIQRTQS